MSLLATNPYSGTARSKSSPFRSTCSPTCAEVGAKTDESGWCKLTGSSLTKDVLAKPHYGGVHEKGADWILGLVDRRDLSASCRRSHKVLVWDGGGWDNLRLHFRGHRSW